MRAITVLSTKSSLAMNGNPAISSTNSSAQRVCGTQHIPDLTMSATEFNRANLSPLPRCGVYSPTGIPVRRSSWYSAVPLDFFSTMKLSGSHSRYSSMANSLSSGNSSRFLIELSRMML